MVISVCSIVIPSYNSELWIEEAIESCLAQTHASIEVVVVDDGSTDNTRQLLRRYSGRIRYVYQDNKGLAAARNTGINHAMGQYIQFLDSDDLIAPQKIEKQLYSLRPYTAPAVSISDYYCCELGDVSTPIAWYRAPWLDRLNPLLDLATRWETKLSIPPHSFVFDARIFREWGVRFDEALPTHEDWDCWMRVFAHSPEIAFVHERLAIYRVRPNSMSRNSQKMRDGFTRAIRTQMKLHKSNKPLVSALKRKLADVRQLYGDDRLLRTVWDALPRRLQESVPWRIRRHVG